MVAGFMFLWAMFQQYFPHQLRGPLEKYGHQLKSLVYPYIQITFHEYGGERFKRSDVFTAIDSYLTVNSSKSAKRLRADMGENAKSLILCMDDHEEVADEFDGVKLWWSSKKTIPKPQPFSYFSAPEEKRFYKLTFHKRHRDLITGRYLNHVLEQGKAVRMRNRQRKLYTNNKKAVWSHVVFDHPATFETLAMDPQKKKEIVDDLITFSKAKDHYSMIGKAWKRGYLLYGPPGTVSQSL
uniref:AAA-type ATPase N-terminal domain-containing protein n=1 Tax=Nelumbo nucifera TaxID=4432 RepID=A0A822Z432_NELNU|nr:TPA_asm: hypothetical protein HUJ06_008387 [Nelumbo nucifera]